MKRGANFVDDAACQQQAQTLHRSRSAVFYSRNPRVGVDGSFDVEADPVNQRQQTREVLRHHSRRVQADAKADRA